MLTFAQIAARILFWVLIGLGLALTVVIGRLSTGPIALDWLKPKIEQALTPEIDMIGVNAERTELRLNRESRTLELVGVGVRYGVLETADLPARIFLTFPEVQITLSAEAFLKQGMIAASDITAKAPSLKLSRSVDGVISLRSEVIEEGPTPDVDFGAFLRRFVLAPEDDSRLAFLKRLQIGGGRVVFEDRNRSKTLTADAADLILTRREGGVEGWLRADVLQPSSTPAVLQLSGRIGKGAERIDIEADLADLMPADLPALWPLENSSLPAGLSGRLEGIRLPVRISVDGTIGLDGTSSPLEVELQAAAGTIELPADLTEPIEVASAELEGVIGRDLTGLRVERARIESRGTKLEAAGEVAWQGEAPTIALDLEIDDLRAEDLPAFWPPDIGIDAREWVLDNIQTGRVDEASVQLDLQSDDFGPEPLRDEAIEGAFAFEGLTVRYIDEMPPLEAVAGEVTFDADRMDFDARSGRNAGLSLKGGKVTITGMGKPGRLATQLHVLADVEGPIERALSLLDHPPLEVAKELSISPASTSGDVAAKLEVRLPLHDDVTEEEAIVLAEAELSDAALEGLPKLGDAFSLKGGTFNLVLDEEVVTLDGTASINDIPLDIDIVEPRNENEEARRRISLAGSVDPAGLGLSGKAVDALAGNLAFNATVTETASTFWIDLEADLEPLAITPPGLAWKKAAGEAGVLRASIAVPVEGPIEIKQFDLQTEELEAVGTLALSEVDQAFQSLELSAFRQGESDAAIRISPDGQGGFELVVEADRLDFDALFEGDETDPAFERFRVILKADQLRARGVELQDVEADAVHASEGWRTASVIGALPSGGKLALELLPDGDDRRLEIRSEDAGALIKALDLGQRVEGGTALLTVRLPSAENAPKEGRVEVENFLLQDAPLLARMLTLASLTGIGNLLGGEGIQMDQLILPFTLDDQTLTFTDGLLRGSQLGLTVKGDVGLANETLDLAGTIIPVYSLNRLIGQVPILGRILTGVDGRGAFAATYGIEGPRASPTVYVNPLSILTPGLLRDLVGGLIDGTLEPPEVRETDD